MLWWTIGLVGVLVVGLVWWMRRSGRQGGRADPAPYLTSDYWSWTSPSTGESSHSRGSSNDTGHCLDFSGSEASGSVEIGGGGAD